MQSCPGVQFLCSSQLKAIHSRSFWYLDPKVDVPNSVPILIAHMYLSGLWLGVAPRTTIKKTSVWEVLNYVPPYLLNNTITNIQHGFVCVCVCGRRGYTTNEHENLHFGYEQNLHMSSKNYEESGYDLNLDLLTTL